MKCRYSVGAACLACSLGCGQEEEGTVRMMVHLYYLLVHFSQGKSYDKSINGSYVKFLLRDKDQGLLK